MNIIFVETNYLESNPILKPISKAKYKSIPIIKSNPIPIPKAKYKSIPIIKSKSIIELIKKN